MFDLTGRTALVTGASRGIGRTACLGFAAAGADIVIHYNRQRDAAISVAKDVMAMGRRADVVQADLADPDEIESMMTSVSTIVGVAGLHILLNNAGIYPTGTIETVDVAQWDHVMAVNARGPFLCTKYALPLLKQAQDARVINVGTILTHRGSTGMLDYISSKAAVVGLTHALVRELGPYGITINCIIPSHVETEMSGPVDPPVLAEQAIQRPQQPEDLLGLLIFLASRASSFTTGQTILSDGGRILL